MGVVPRFLPQALVVTAPTQAKPLRAHQNKVPVLSLPRTTAQGNLQTPKMWLH